MKIRGHNKCNSVIIDKSFTSKDTSFFLNKISPVRNLDVFQRDIQLSESLHIPRNASVLSIKEGRVFIIGGNASGGENSQFIEFVEDYNALLNHSHLQWPRVNLGTCFLSEKVYAVGGLNLNNQEEWFNCIESIPLPELPQLEFQNNYDTIQFYQSSNINQDSMPPRSDWHLYSEWMEHGARNISIVTQKERYIYAFCGVIGKPDLHQPIIDEKPFESIQVFDTITEEWDQFRIKWEPGIKNWFLANSVAVQSPVDQNSSFLLFGGKVRTDDKNKQKTVFLISNQSSEACEELGSKYQIKGKGIKFQFEDQNTGIFKKFIGTN